MTTDATVTCRVGEFEVRIFSREVDGETRRMWSVHRPGAGEFDLSELQDLMAALAGASKAEDALDEG